MIINKTISYLKEVFAGSLLIGELDEGQYKGLPLHIRSGYTFYDLTIDHQDVVLADPKGDEQQLPGKLHKDVALLTKTFGKKVVFLFDRINPYLRSKLIENRTPFIVPDKQMYLPFMGVSFTEFFETKRNPRTALRPASQVVLLYHLEMEDIENRNFQSIGNAVSYSAMTVTRAAEELATFGLAEIIGRKDKSIRFLLKGRELFENALAYLISPINDEFYIDQLDAQKIAHRLYKTADQALSLYSDLTPGRQESRAIDSKTYDFLKEISRLKSQNKFEGQMRIEKWVYSPGILTRIDMVDPISLYLSMRSIQDERVEMALDQLLNKIKW